MKHGAKVKKCSDSTCTNFSQKGGVYKKHGAKLKSAAILCVPTSLKGGVCIKHGAKLKKCSNPKRVPTSLKRVDSARNMVPN
jgi:hypothetical protein